MSGIADWLKSIWQGISNVSREIVDGIGGFFSTIFDYLNPLSENFILKDIISFFGELLSYLNPFSENFILKILFDWISDLIKSVFVPDTQVINEQFNSTLSKLNNKLGITMFNLDNLFDTSVSPTDIEGNYTIGSQTYNLKFTNFDVMAQGVEFFRPWIRGMIVLLLFFFNIRQLMSMFGLDSGEINAWYQNSKGRDGE